MKFSEWLKITHIQHFLHNIQCLGIFIQLNDSSVHKNVLTELSIKTYASKMKHCTWITGIGRMQSSTKKRFPWTAIRSKSSFDGKKHFDWFNKWRNFCVLLCYCMNINYYTKKRKYRNELFIYKQKVWFLRTKVDWKSIFKKSRSFIIWRLIEIMKFRPIPLAVFTLLHMYLPSCHKAMGLKYERITNNLQIHSDFELDVFMSNTHLVSGICQIWF